jgi:hypothetical protein
MGKSGVNLNDLHSIDSVTSHAEEDLTLSELQRKKISSQFDFVESPKGLLKKSASSSVHSSFASSVSSSHQSSFHQSSSQKPLYTSARNTSTSFNSASSSLSSSPSRAQYKSGSKKRVLEPVSKSYKPVVKKNVQKSYVPQKIEKKYAKRTSNLSGNSVSGFDTVPKYTKLDSKLELDEDDLDNSRAHNSKLNSDILGSQNFRDVHDQNSSFQSKLKSISTDFSDVGGEVSVAKSSALEKITSSTDADSLIVKPKLTGQSTSVGSKDAIKISHDVTHSELPSFNALQELSVSSTQSTKSVQSTSSATQSFAQPVQASQSGVNTSHSFGHAVDSILSSIGFKPSRNQVQVPSKSVDSGTLLNEVIDTKASSTSTFSATPLPTVSSDDVVATVISDDDTISKVLIDETLSDSINSSSNSAMSAPSPSAPSPSASVLSSSQQRLELDKTYSRQMNYLDNLKRRLDLEMRERRILLQQKSQDLGVKELELVKWENALLEKERIMTQNFAEYARIKELEQKLEDVQITIQTDKQKLDEAHKLLAEKERTLKEYEQKLTVTQRELDSQKAQLALEREQHEQTIKTHNVAQFHKFFDAQFTDLKDDFERKLVEKHTQVTKRLASEQSVRANLQNQNSSMLVSQFTQGMVPAVTPDIHTIFSSPSHQSSLQNDIEESLIRAYEHLADGDMVAAKELYKHCISLYRSLAMQYGDNVDLHDELLQLYRDITLHAF